MEQNPAPLRIAFCIGLTTLCIGMVAGMACTGATGVTQCCRITKRSTNNTCEHGLPRMLNLFALRPPTYPVGVTGECGATVVMLQVFFLGGSNQ